MDDDATLLARFRAGDRTAFDDLVRRHQQPIFLLALRYLEHTEDARDVAQRAFVQAYQQLGAFRGDASFRTWVYRIAANLAMDALRKRGRDARLQRELDTPLQWLRERDRLSVLEEKQRLRAAVAALPPKQRLVVELRIFDDLAFREVAEIAACSEDAAKVNFHHALRRLRVLIGPKNEDGDES